MIAARGTGADTDEEDAVQLPVRTYRDEEPRVAEARRRWRAMSDRLWPIALSDGESYRAATHAVGALVEALRGRARSLEELVDLEAAPSSLPGGPGSTAPQPELLAAACAVVGDELAADRARRRRAALIADAHATGRTWVELDRSATRVTEMHVASGTTLVATTDPYSGDTAFRITETVLDPVSGEPSAGARTSETTFPGEIEWEAGRERRRREITERLDRRDPDGSDSERTFPKMDTMAEDT